MALRFDLRKTTPRAYGSALFTAAIGILSVGTALQHPIGSLMRSGPGLYPLVLGVLLLGISVALLIENENEEAESGAPSLRATLSILGSVLAFGILIKPAGAVAATTAMVVLASLGQDRFRLGWMIFLVVVLNAFNVFVFIDLLLMPMNAFPWS